MRQIKTGWIIHIFALLHIAVTLICRYFGIGDELLLTVLTMAMALLICMKKNLGVEFTAAIIMVVNIIGYLMGTFVAGMLEMSIRSTYAVHALSTAITTEVLGWSIVAITTIFRPRAESYSESRALSSPYMKWVLLAAGGIFVLRLTIVFIFSGDPTSDGGVLDITGKVLSNSVALTILVCINILFIRFAVARMSGWKVWSKTVTFIIFMLLAAIVETFLVMLGLPDAFGNDLAGDFHILYAVSLITQLTVYCIVYMINYAITARHEMEAEREKANMAQYRYVKLKRQVNPHFLFNSLNILDCLICEEKTEQASIYTHKLAGIYRYMIKSEEEEVVPLRDELVFVGLYVDLLKVRFPEGFEVKVDVPEDLMARFVLPCSIQLLIENATKHNAVSPDQPLVIQVTADGDEVNVCNNIIPKVTKSQSTGLGQKYIRQMYLDRSGKSIKIEKTEEYYSVTLPLL